MVEIKNNFSEININGGGTTIKIDDDKNKNMIDFSTPKFGNNYSFQDITDSINIEEQNQRFIGYTPHVNKDNDFIFSSINSQPLPHLAEVVDYKPQSVLRFARR